MKEYIRNRVHELYWKDDINCARTAIICLSELFETVVEPQTIWSAVGLHGAGGYRAQCGLVEGTLMFIGIYFHVLGKPESEIVSACHDFAAAFDREFGSLRCYELRPAGFSESDPPHMCENLTCNGIEFAYRYISEMKMGGNVYKFKSKIYTVPQKGGAYIKFPYDIRKEFGKGRVKVHVTFDGIPYDGSIVNMGVQNPDGSICYIIGMIKSIREQLKKSDGDEVEVTVCER